MVGGDRIAYLSAGEGMPVVLLHGWPQTSPVWRKVIPLLAHGHSVIAPDLPGIGASSKPRGGFEKVAVAAKLTALMETLGHERDFVVGHDMGGQVACPLAASQGDRAAGLFFMESGLPGCGQKNAMNVATGGSWHFGFSMAGDISETLVQGKEHAFVSSLLRRDKIGIASEDSIPDEISLF